MGLRDKKSDLETIFLKGVQCVDPEQLIADTLSLQGEQLSIRTGDGVQTIDLSSYQRIVVLGFGKATAKMAASLEAALGDRISEGVIVVKYGHTETLNKIKMLEAGHPVPDGNGIKAAQLLAGLARKADQQTLVMTLISGGGSALTPLPLKVSIDNHPLELSLEEKQAVTRILLECGATITEINCVRKHLSGIKGGRLAELMMPASSVNLILSDVIGDRLDTIASGTTVPDESSFSDMAAVFERYDISEKMPASVLKILEAGLAGKIPETPGPDHPAFKTCHTHLIGTNRLALQAAKSEAERLGYHTMIFTSQLSGEAAEVAKVLMAIARENKQQRDDSRSPICLLFGGETTVTIKGEGKGGRNQEMALSLLNEMSQDPAATRGIYCLAASTDGNDGPTDAAGAFAATEILEDVKTAGLSINAYLRANDSYHFFEQIGHLLKTGPTNTNVCDIQAILIE